MVTIKRAEGLDTNEAVRLCLERQVYYPPLSKELPPVGPDEPDE